jgi:N-acetylglucosamine kinase-like BadF-type ATPase
VSSLYVGIDGGGTRTRAVVADSDLVVKARGTAGPSNASQGSLAHVMEVIHEALDEGLAAAGVSQIDLKGICCGLAGVDASGLRERLQWGLEKIFGYGRILVTTDARIALAGATHGPADAPGIVMIAGTGAISFGRNRQGTEARAGGWGALLGDEGSGFSIARKGLASVMRDFDGRGPATVLRTLLQTSEGLNSPSELLQRVQRMDSTPAAVAAFFPLVLSAAREGDKVCCEIFRRAGEELGLSALTVTRRLEMEKEEFTVATVGGVFAAGELILEPIRRVLAEQAPGARIAQAAFPPEIGAVRLLISSESSSLNT